MLDYVELQLPIGQPDDRSDHVVVTIGRTKYKIDEYIVSPRYYLAVG
jgi:hypothetical protein